MGKKLASGLEKWLKGYNRILQELGQSGFKATSTNAREGLANLTFSLVTKKPEIEWVQDDLVEGEEFDVPVRIYHPRPESRLPVLVYLHGGGHMAGSITVYDAICRKMAIAADHVVVSADYRLAPECPYPAGIDDAVTVAENIRAVLEQRKINYTRQLSIAGDSAGGAMCATLSHLSAHHGGPQIQKQVLIYPSLDYTMGFESVALNGRGYLLEKEKIAWYFDNYFRHGDDRRKASPLFMDFSEDMPKTLIVTAEFCPLRDEGFAYAKKLADAGVPHEHVHFDDMIHAFMNMEDLVKERCAELYQHIGQFLNR